MNTRLVTYLFTRDMSLYVDVSPALPNNAVAPFVGDKTVSAEQLVFITRNHP